MQADTANPPHPSEEPIACSLDLETGRDRRQEWLQLIRSSLSSRAVTPTGVRLTFVARPQVDRQLAQLVEFERECCAFASWTVTHEDRETVLCVDSRGEGIDAIQQLFRA